jgi:hypothetical protein
MTLTINNKSPYVFRFKSFLHSQASFSIGTFELSSSTLGKVAGIRCNMLEDDCIFFAENMKK